MTGNDYGMNGNLEGVTLDEYNLLMTRGAYDKAAYQALYHQDISRARSAAKRTSDAQNNYLPSQTDFSFEVAMKTGWVYGVLGFGIAYLLMTSTGHQQHIDDSFYFYLAGFPLGVVERMIRKKYAERTFSDPLVRFLYYNGKASLLGPKIAKQIQADGLWGFAPDRCG